MTDSQKKRNKKSDIWGYLVFGFLFLMVGLIYLSDYVKHGWVYSYKYERILAHGYLANFICFMFLAMGGALIFLGLKQAFTKEKPNQTIKADEN